MPERFGALLSYEEQTVYVQNRNVFQVGRIDVSEWRSIAAFGH